MAVGVKTWLRRVVVPIMMLVPTALAFFGPVSAFGNGFRPGGPSVAVAPQTVSWQAGCLQAPVPGAVIDTFQAPECPYCAGRRTLRFAASPRDEVYAPVAGRITFAGRVAGIGYVTVEPAGAPSHLVTVGGVNSDGRKMSGLIERGAVIGSVADDKGIHLSVRQVHPSGHPSYLDPEPFLERLWVRARLAPLDGSPPRPSQQHHGCRVGSRAVP